MKVILYEELSQQINHIFNHTFLVAIYKKYKLEFTNHFESKDIEFPTVSITE